MMKLETSNRTRAGWTGSALAVPILILLLGLSTGCKHAAQAPTAPSDQQIASDIQKKLSGESALADGDIHVSVANGVATLSGTVNGDAERALAGTESGSIGGVKTVVNNLSVQPVPGPAPQQAAAPAPVEKPSTRQSRKNSMQSQPAPVQYAQPAPAPMQRPQPAPAYAQQAPPPPPPVAPKPVVKEVTLAAGTVVPVRMTETLDSKTAQPNDVFHGSLSADLVVDGVVAMPRGTPVMGRVAAAKDAAHFKGSALLSLELTEATVRGRRVTLTTEAYNQQGAGRGKNTAEKAGGGAAFGAIIGALAGGGKGAAIGGLAGAGVGTGINAATRGQQVVIQSESIVTFRLQSPVMLSVTLSGRRDDVGDSGNEPGLQRR